MVDSALPSRIAGRYRVLATLGRGGMGEVYRAYDEKLGREVALKMLADGKSRDPDARRRLIREARAVSRIEHPGIVRVFDIGQTEDDDVFLVMELIDGKNLRELAEAGALDVERVLRIVGDVAATLDAVHAAGIVHRDVKPENVMVAADARILLLDFGITRVLPEAPLAAMVSTQLTDDGTVLGTPAYVSPEQANGDDVGPASDQFSLAVMAYELLSGRLPWAASTTYAMIGQILTGEPLAPSTLGTGLPPACDRVLAQAMAKSPSQRYPTARAFAAALEEAFLPTARTQAPTEPARSSGTRIERRRPRAAWWGVGAIAAAMSIGLGARTIRLVPPARPTQLSAKIAPSPLASPEAVLACPIFRASGVREPAGWLGAAAAERACFRAGTILGGRLERTLSPAELLDLPKEPVADFPDDPYVVSGARERSLEAARARAQAFLDGSVAEQGGTYEVELVLRRSDGAEIARAKGRGPAVLIAVFRAVDSLGEGAGLPKASAVEPEMARWLGIRRLDALLATQWLQGPIDAEVCAGVARYKDELGPYWFAVPKLCPTLEPTTELAPRLDRSSREALAKTAWAYASERPAEARVVAADLETALVQESSPLGRALLATAAAELWEVAADLDRARTAHLEGVRAAPRYAEWTELAVTGRDERYARAAAAWQPADLAFALVSKLNDALRLRYARRWYELGHDDLRSAASVAKVVLSLGEREELLAMAASRPGNTDEQRRVRDYLYALVARSEGKFNRAFEAEQAIVQRAERGELDQPTIELIALGDLLGRAREAADAWIGRFLLGEGADARRGNAHYIVAPAMCMRASPDVAKGCFERIRSISGGDAGAPADGADALLRGAELYAAGNARAAVDAWRPLLKDELRWYLRVIPMDAFARAGEDELAEHLEAEDLADKGWGGISLAHPRAALRAAARGDRERARKLARETIDAWIAADVEVPAVAEMQALLRRLR